MAATPPPLSSFPASGTPPSAAPAGRIKALRWCRDTPPSGKSGDGVAHPSFKDVLLAAIKPTAPPAVPSSPTTSVKHGGASPRVVLHPRASQPSGSVPVESDGWQTVVCRRSRKVLRRVERRPYRPVPADLRGQCFNCFSPSHRAAVCRIGPRCFHCRAIGHRSYACPSRHLPPTASAHRRLMWRPVSGSTPAAAMAAHAPGGSSSVPVEHGAGDPPARRRRQVRKRRRNRAPPSSAPKDSGDSPSLASVEDEYQVAAGEGSRRPRRIIQRSAAIDQREEELAGRAVVITVVADSPEALVDSILLVFARRFEIEESLLAIHKLGPASYLLISPDLATATRIISDGRPINIPPGRLHITRWSRFLSSTVSTLPSTVEIELRGIPAHAWELDTAAQLLDDCCLPCGIHPVSDTQREVYRFAAWCSNPGSIPHGIDLVLPEPKIAARGPARERHCLLYPMSIG
ncbi:hypothetical protein PVAP13_8NG177700, partial [Panicum virgatum]